MSAGWYGKLPSLGDFASRRLAPESVGPWDAWLADGLHALQAAAPERWLADYLASPPWRFALLPGALAGAPGPGLQLGVLLPSRDRVGRHFPLLLTAATVQPRDGLGLGRLWRWAGQLEALALQAVQLAWSPEQLDAELQALGPAPEVATEPDHDATLAPHELQRLAQAQAQAADMPEGLAAVCAQAAWVGLQGHSLWFSRGTAQPWLPWVVRGLPSGSGFARLFSPGTD